jgi:hypothetical protein
MLKEVSNGNPKPNIQPLHFSPRVIHTRIHVHVSRELVTTIINARSFSQHRAFLVPTVPRAYGSVGSTCKSPCGTMSWNHGKARVYRALHQTLRALVPRFRVKQNRVLWRTVDRASLAFVL